MLKIQNCFGHYLKKYSFVLSLIILTLFLLGGVILFNYNSIPIAKAGSTQNVWGWAWSANIGWISFNSKDCDSNEDGKSDGGGGCPAPGTPISNYGVNIAPDGLFSGYAWSENIGWISFNQSELGDCPSGPCQAVLDLDTKQISGWARALSFGGGWDGWIKLRKGPADSGEDYGVFLDPANQELRGWAWGSEVVSWLSFNCKDGGGCPWGAQTSFNSPPTATNLSAVQGDYCNFAEVLKPRFDWIFSDPEGDSQGAYQIQVATTTNFSLLVSDSGKVLSSSFSWTPISPLPYYNTTYYWRLRVWDNKGATSTNWIYPPSPAGSPSPAPGASFETPEHAYPQPNFEWLPKRVSQGEFIQFCSVKTPTGSCSTTVSVSKCYDAEQKVISCSGKAFFWTFPETSTTTENPKVKFSSKGKDKVVSLQITDEVGVCTTTKSVDVVAPLPKWKEVAP